jgi:hypothetical protein
MSLLVLRCLELVLPFRMVELRILQLKLMSPHREPSPVHYMTKPPVTAAYLRGRRCCLCQRDFILDNRRVKSWCVNFCDTCIFRVSLFLSLYSRS